MPPGELARRNPNSNSEDPESWIEWLPLQPSEHEGEEGGDENPSGDDGAGQLVVVQEEEEKLPEEGEFSDAFTDEGQPIEDPCSYLKSRLTFHTKERYDTLIPRIIASINRRQPNKAGFSFSPRANDLSPRTNIVHDHPMY